LFHPLVPKVHNPESFRDCEIWGKGIEAISKT
jgi:hypothetical protein